MNEAILSADGRGPRLLNCRNFSAIAEALNRLRDLEDAESGLHLARMNVMDEMPRLVTRQFEWQRGFLNIPQLYRWSYILGGPQSSAAFQTSTGLSMSDFSLVGFALCAGLASRQLGWPTLTSLRSEFQTR